MNKSPDQRVIGRSWAQLGQLSPPAVIEHGSQALAVENARCGAARAPKHLAGRDAGKRLAATLHPRRHAGGCGGSGVRALLDHARF
jgi:hypothetical protein